MGSRARKPRITSSLTSTIEVIMPKEAARILEEDNDTNRPLHPNVVKNYSIEMRQQQWSVNGESIKFYADGGLADGQHRLAACVETGIPLETVVIRGLERDDFHTIDQGLRRGPSDILGLMGHKNTGTLGSALRWIWILEEPKGRMNQKFSASHIRAGIEENPEAVDSVNKIRNWSRMGTKVLGQHGLAAGMHYHLSQIDSADAEEYMYRVVTGLRITRDDEPEQAVRRRLQRYGRGGEKARASVLVEIIIRGWNARRQNRTLRKVMIPSTAYNDLPTAV